MWRSALRTPLAVFACHATAAACPRPHLLPSHHQALTVSPPPPLFPCLPSPLQTLVYDRPQYANVDLPFDIYTLAVLNSVLMGGVELFRNTELDPEARCYPGGAFDPLKLASEPGTERTDKLREAEIKHARLAMVAFLGYTVQAWATGEGVLGSLQKFSANF